VRALFRSPVVQVALAAVLAAYLKLCIVTTRWR
jgi:hypothetical protein